MESRKPRTFAGGFAAGVIAAIVLLAAAVLVVVYSGAYNVAATEEHLAITRWAFHTNMHHAVRQRAGEAPRAEAATPAMLAAGAREYRESCQHCHGGPGVKREHWADGMRPRPPHLVDAAPEWKPGEIFWIVKHGVKMTGMPAFGSTHDDQTLLSIAAFVKELPAMSPERYAQLGASGEPEKAHGSAVGASGGATGGTR